MSIIRFFKNLIKKHMAQKADREMQRKLDLIRRLNEEISAEREALAIQQKELQTRLSEIARYNVLMDNVAQNKAALENKIALLEINN